MQAKLQLVPIGQLGKFAGKKVRGAAAGMHCLLPCPRFCPLLHSSTCSAAPDWLALSGSLHVLQCLGLRDMWRPQHNDSGHFSICQCHAQAAVHCSPITRPDVNHQAWHTPDGSWKQPHCSVADARSCHLMLPLPHHVCLLLSAQEPC